MVGERSEKDAPGPYVLETDEEHAEDIRICDLPPLPSRDPAYFTEPLLGVLIVGGLTSMTVVACHFLATPAMKVIVLPLIWMWAGLATCGVLFLLFGSPGVVRRSPVTCYPIPPEVQSRLLSSRPLHGLGNVVGPENSETHGSYCIRCFVWRPPSTSGNVSHHCGVCQRCVIGFDHHCGVYGRCIVKGNMPCFYLVLLMLPAGISTLLIAILITEGPM
mmetsp:Transcript_59112/g.157306  ORF Transcript_59112/g.157306 Transcript_59112/m.157306 type:complete len:218 (-) Transcript_59112:91-744(-)